MKMSKEFLESVVSANKSPEQMWFAAWLQLQRYKLYHPLGVRIARWWLRVRYGWDDDKECFV
jgi:hypothetical protein